MQSTSLDAYAQYIASEQRPRQVDEFILTGLFERAIAEAARRRWSGDTAAEEALRTFWIGYLDAQASFFFDLCVPDPDDYGPSEEARCAKY